VDEVITPINPDKKRFFYISGFFVPPIETAMLLLE
jgi:hypothetical protein